MVWTPAQWVTLAKPFPLWASRSLSKAGVRSDAHVDLAGLTPSPSSSPLPGLGLEPMGPKCSQNPSPRTAAAPSRWFSSFSNTLCDCFLLLFAVYRSVSLHVNLALHTLGFLFFSLMCAGVQEPGLAHGTWPDSLSLSFLNCRESVGEGIKE